MKRQINRILKRANIIFTDLKRDMFSVPLNMTSVNFLLNIFECAGNSGKFVKKLKYKRNEQIFRYIYKQNKDVFDKYKFDEKDGANNDTKRIWICWLSGEENAPDLVKKCINSIRDSAEGCVVEIITLDNYEKFIKLSDTIKTKYSSGKIGNAHFSDILRVNLINNWGGLWMDATVFCPRKLPCGIFDYSFYSCKSPTIKGTYISEYQWTTFLLAGKKGCTFYSFMCDFYNSYWEKNDCAIDYLFMDYVIALARKEILHIDKLIENVPMNNLQRDKLQELFNEPLDKEIFDDLINSDTYIFKTSWRMNFIEETLEGNQTFYGYFMNN